MSFAPGYIGTNTMDQINNMSFGLTHNKEDYLLRSHLLAGNRNFDIMGPNLVYSDCSPTHHGLQCNHRGGTPEHVEMLELCSQLTELIKKIDKLNGLKQD